MDKALKSFFGYSSLRPYQKVVIENVLAGNDALVVMATGSGKSICYQIPPLVCNKTAVVISPLLSLMQDQVMSLKQKGITADYLGSTQMNPSVMHDAENGTLQVLYMTPERATSLPQRFWSKLFSKGVCLFAIDEAHCISEWGHDFRVEYKQLHVMRNLLPGVPFLALTATATDRVRQDIMSSLQLADPNVFVGTFDRPNLFYGVKSCEQNDIFINDLVARCRKSEPTIVYCATIRDTEQIHSTLQSHGISVAMYHGQMGSKEREDSHRSFIRDDVQVMVATIAFGMGIDKPDVRCVIHYGCPKSLESYYQESGRCGRDGLPSVCWLYYKRSDFKRGDFYCSEAATVSQRTVIMESFLASKNYCLLGSCRRQSLLLYFGEESAAECGNCDNCISGTRTERDFGAQAVALLSSIRACGERWGLNLPIDVLRGSRSRKVVDKDYHKLPIHGTWKQLSQNWWKSFACILINQDYIAESARGTYRYIRVSDKGNKFLDESNGGTQQFLCYPTQEMMKEEQVSQEECANLVRSQPAQDSNTDFSKTEMELYQFLLKIRSKIAEDERVPPYAICGDQVIRSFATIRPSSSDSMCLVDGVSMNFIEKHSSIFLHYICQKSKEMSLLLDNDASHYVENSTEEFSVDATSEDYNTLGNANDVWPIASSTNDILYLVRSFDGVSYEQIAMNFASTEHDSLKKTLDDLECAFEIFKKNGLYHPM